MVGRISAKEQEVVQNDILVVLDGGYGHMKALSSLNPLETIKFPSTVLMNPTSAISRFSDKRTEPNVDELMVEVNGQRCYVGERALAVPELIQKRTEARNRAGDVRSQVLMQTAIAMALPHKSGTYENIYLVTGLPNEDYTEEKIKELSDFLSTPFTIKLFVNNVDYIEKEIKVSTVSIYRQPEGTYAAYQYRLGEYKNGESLIERSENYSDFLAIFDIGHLTTDYCLFQNGDLITNPRTMGSTKGIREVYIELKVHLEDFLGKLALNRDVNDADLDRAIYKGVLFKRNKYHDVTDLVEESVQAVADFIAPYLYDKWTSSFDSIEVMLGTGGGVELLDKALDAAFRDKTERKDEKLFVKMEDAQDANVLGYYILGLKELASIIGEEKAYELYCSMVFQEA